MKAQLTVAISQCAKRSLFNIRAMPGVTESPNYSLTDIVGYFLRLGTLGFGGPVALVGFMHRDLSRRNRRGWRHRGRAGCHGQSIHKRDGDAFLHHTVVLVQHLDLPDDEPPPPARSRRLLQDR